MTRQRHAIPTGLAVEDRFLTYGAYSLSLRQFLILAAGIALAYGLWKDHPELPLPLRAAAAAGNRWTTGPSSSPATGGPAPRPPGVRCPPGSARGGRPTPRSSA